MSLNYSRVLWAACPWFFILAVLMHVKGCSIFFELSLASVNSVQMSFPIIVDYMSGSLMFTVLFISSNVLHLANLYMEDEVYLKRFTFLVLLLIASMGALILVPHITALLLGWDGLGLVSFLLVVFYASPKALGAGMLTALTNRLGDAMILVSIAFMLEYNHHFELVSFFSQPVACFFLMVAGMTKSAQLPLSAWLPAAMEAPTPVSALVHSSTLVTAGVYLMIRLYGLLSQSLIFSSFILIIGAVTSMLAGLSAMAECDMKKIIALSTLSQLGFMMMSLGLGYPKLAFFHLITHAMLKALLFVCAGVIIHFHGHAQDIRQMGGVSIQFPFTAAAISVSKMALCAFPFMSGFYSKDAILEAFFWSPYGSISVFIAMVSTILTAMYSTRFFVRVLFPAQSGVPAVRFSEPFIFPMFSLATGAIVSGSMVSSLAGPLLVESFNPAVKVFLIAMVFISIIFIVTLKHNLEGSEFYSKVLLFSASSDMLFLSNISTQGVLSASTVSLSSISKTDQSWFELGQTKVSGVKGSDILPTLMMSSFFMALSAMVVLVFFS
nr:NADH dehydrogenase subunit 5 [Armandia sp. GK-2021]